ncbi:MAG: DUF484 family protein [Sulfuricellaceae bacterium]|nr:DUF484 family protein [Sulfuricellaceae bacterium]
MNADDIANYLKSTPEFFEQYADMLSEVYIPHPHGGRAISLSERQILSLREKNHLLESRLRELIGFGEENDAISEKSHRFALSLFDPHSFESLVQAIRSNLQEIFAIPHVALRVWGGLPERSGVAEFTPVGLEVCAMADQLAHPSCGHSVSDEIRAWFGEDGTRLQSFALIPLRHGAAFGLLALASEDPQRFYPEMGTIYLQRLSELVGAALHSRLEAAD